MKYLVWLSAFVLAACAAFVSVFGLGQLFAGAGTIVLVMVGGMEFAKLVAASALHRYWSKLNGLMKTYLTAGVVVFIMMTSIGIYGFLSNGYQKTANKLAIETTEISYLEDKKGVFDTRINGNNAIIENKTKRANTLTDLRNNQEVRLDSLLAKNYITNANRVRKDIADANKEIQKLNNDIDELMVDNVTLADSSASYQRQIIEIQSISEVAAEVGPLKYLADLTGQPMDKVVNILILLIMFVFDPMAVTLLILGNRILELESEDKKPKPKKKREWFKSFKKEKKAEPEELVETDDEVETNEGWKLDEIIPEEDTIEVVVPEGISEEVSEEVAEEAPETEVNTNKGVEPKGKIDEEDIPMLRGDNRNFSVDIPAPKPQKSAEKPKGRLWFKKIK